MAPPFPAEFPQDFQNISKTFWKEFQTEIESFWAPSLIPTLTAAVPYIEIIVGVILEERHLKRARSLTLATRTLGRSAVQIGLFGGDDLCIYGQARMHHAHGLA
jgi:hypothetical protein